VRKELVLKLRRLVLTETILELLQLEQEQEEVEMLERLQAEVVQLHGRSRTLHRHLLPASRRILQTLDATVGLLQQQEKKEKEERPEGGGVPLGEKEVRDQRRLSNRIQLVLRSVSLDHSTGSCWPVSPGKGSARRSTGRC
jgi:hypothetical protein